MKLSVKLKGKDFILDEWEPVGPLKSYRPNWVRRLSPTDNFSLVGLQVSWADEDIHSGKHHW